MSDSDLAKLNKYMGGTDDAAAFTVPFGGSRAEQHRAGRILLDDLRKSSKNKQSKLLVFDSAIDRYLKDNLPFHTSIYSTQLENEGAGTVLVNVPCDSNYLPKQQTDMIALALSEYLGTGVFVDTGLANSQANSIRWNFHISPIG